MKHDDIRISNREIRFKKAVNLAFIYIILLMLTVFFLSPITMLFFSSFKTGEEYMYAKSVFQPPKNFLNLDNYITVFNVFQLLNGYKNSAIIIFFSTIGSVLLSSSVAFVLTRFQFKFKNLIIGLYLLMNIVPTIVVEVFRFTFMSKVLHLYDNHAAGIVLYTAAEVLSIYIYIQAMKNIPLSLDESAIMDGASYFKVFRSIIFPLVMPATATVVILKVITIYNDFFIPFLYLPGMFARTATVSVYFAAGDVIAKVPQLSAGLILLMIPTVIVYLILQKWIISGITSGSVNE
jgi:ABC-type glycerol-3-phosphate transport system permease component